MKYLYSFNSHSDFYNKGMVLEDDNVVLCKDTDINKWHGHYQHPPYDTEIEYLESTGTQYIDTGYKTNNQDNFQLICDVDATSGWMGSNGNLQMDLRINPSPSRRVFKVTHSANSGPITYINNTQVKSQSYHNYNNYIIALFALGFGEDTVHYYDATEKLYSSKLIINNVIVRDLIPVRVGNVGYLFDKVSGQLFGNAGTGSFILGPDIKPIEYLQSSGTQKIDTGINYNLTSKIKIEMETTIINENRCVLISNYCDGNAACISCEVGGTSNSHARTPRFYMSLTNKNTTSDTWAGVAVPLNTLNNVIFEYDKTTGKKRLTSQTTTNELVFTGNPYGTTQNLLLFLDHRASPSAIAYGVRIGKVKIYINDNIVRYFIPVRVGSTGYMYDKVSGQLFGNAGTGTFTLGNDL